MATYTSTGSGDDGGGLSFDEILRRIAAGIGTVLTPTPPIERPPLPPVYTAGAGGVTQSNLLLIGLVLVVVYLLTR